MFLGNKELDLDDGVVSRGDLEQLGSSSWIVDMVRLVSASY